MKVEARLCAVEMLKSLTYGLEANFFSKTKYCTNLVLSVEALTTDEDYLLRSPLCLRVSESL